MMQNIITSTFTFSAKVITSQTVFHYFNHLHPDFIIKYPLYDILTLHTSGISLN